MEFRVLGPLQVVRAEAEVEISAGRHRALLATLLVRPNRIVSTDELVARIWDDDPPGDARATAQTYVRRLRASLGDEVICTRPGGYQISIVGDQLDLIRFDDLLRRARRADGVGHEAALLAEALGLWRGPALANVPSDALHRDEVPALTERRLRALERRIDLDLAVGEHDELVAELHALVAAHPLRERFWAQLIAALAECGRPAEALQAYEELRTQLAEQLGADPSRQLQDLHRAILRGNGPGLNRQVRSVASTPEPVRPGQLPPDVAGFTGRTTALAELDTVGQATGFTPIVVIEGPPGVGKTALATHWAHRVRERYLDGQLYANLRGHANSAPPRPVEVLAGFLTALGVPAERIPTELDQAIARYRSLLADRRVLVVLDNAADPKQVRPILPGGPGCMVLVTSRNQLTGLTARDGAHRLPLAPLTPDESWALLTQLLGANRIQAEPAAAAELADICGHLPLALRIAAANLTSLPPQPLAGYTQRLRGGDRLSALAVAADDHSQIRTAFDLSYCRLPAATQRLFRRIGLASGLDLAPHAAAAADDITVADARTRLDELARAHLLEQPAPDRYSLHDLLRHYAAARAQQEESEPARRAARLRLHDYYLYTADVAVRHLYPQTVRLPLASPPPGGHGTVRFTDHAAALAWLDAERANLIAAVQHATVDGLHEASWLLADTLRTYLYTRASVIEAMAVAQVGLDAACAGADLRGQAAAHHSLANLHVRAGKLDRARKQFAAAEELSHQAGWAEGQVALASNLGIVHLRLGRLTDAADRFTKAYTLEQQLGLTVPAAALSNLGTVHVALGQLDAAAAYAAPALRASQAVGDRTCEAINHATLGGIARARGLSTQAVAHYQKALAGFRAVGHRSGEAECLRDLAAANRDQDRLDPAGKLARQAVSVAQETGEPGLLAGCLATLASLQPESRYALLLYQAALAQAAQCGEPAPHIDTLIGLATVYHQQGQPEPARRYLQRALTIANRSGHHLRITHGLFAHARRL